MRVRHHTDDAGLAQIKASGGIQPVSSGGSDVCIARWTPDLHALVQETFLGAFGSRFRGESSDST